jgi:hypothetical protein
METPRDDLRDSRAQSRPRRCVCVCVCARARARVRREVREESEKAKGCSPPAPSSRYLIGRMQHEAGSSNSQGASSSGADPSAAPPGSASGSRSAAGGGPKVVLLAYSYGSCVASHLMERCPEVGGRGFPSEGVSGGRRLAARSGRSAALGGSRDRSNRPNPPHSPFSSTAPLSAPGSDHRCFREHRLPAWGHEPLLPRQPQQLGCADAKDGQLG